MLFSLDDDVWSNMRYVLDVIWQQTTEPNDRSCFPLIS